MTTETMTTEEVRNLQSIVPQWMDTVLTEADKLNKMVEVTRQHTPFGTYTVLIIICPE